MSGLLCSTSCCLARCALLTKALVEFLNDGLFCEWAYFIDFEKQTLETFASGELLDVITFDKLREVGEDYMTELEERHTE